MNKTMHYPLSMDEQEQHRLNNQSDLFHDPLLDKIISNASSCLELGCGFGSNAERLIAVNSSLKYTGIDCSLTAVTAARGEHKHANVRFEKMDATKLSFNDNTFDVVFSKCVLWSIGNDWRNAIKESFRVLKPDGVLYCFEPYNKSLTFEPSCPLVESLIAHWDAEVHKKGLDPNIGPKVANELAKIGFSNIQVAFFPVLGCQLSSIRPEDLNHNFNKQNTLFNQIINNLHSFYFNQSDHNPLHDISAEIRNEVIKALYDSGNRIVMDGFYVTWARKA